MSNARALKRNLRHTKTVAKKNRRRSKNILKRAKIDNDISKKKKTKHFSINNGITVSCQYLWYGTKKILTFANKARKSVFKNIKENKDTIAIGMAATAATKFVLCAASLTVPGGAIGSAVLLGGVRRVATDYRKRQKNEISDLNKEELSKKNKISRAYYNKTPWYLRSFVSGAVGGAVGGGIFLGASHIMNSTGASDFIASKATSLLSKMQS